MPKDKIKIILVDNMQGFVVPALPSGISKLVEEVTDFQEDLCRAGQQANRILDILPDGDVWRAIDSARQHIKAALNLGKGTRLTVGTALVAGHPPASSTPSSTISAPAGRKRKRHSQTVVTEDTSPGNYSHRLLTGVNIIHAGI